MPEEVSGPLPPRLPLNLCNILFFKYLRDEEKDEDEDYHNSDLS